MKIIKEKLEVVAEDGKVFVGENAIERCCEYEKLQLKKQLIEEKFKAIDKEKLTIPLLHFFSNSVGEYNYVFWLRSEEDIETIKQWWEAKGEYHYFDNELYKSPFFCRAVYCIAMDGGELYLMEIGDEKRDAARFYNTLKNFEEKHR